jgi:hypothetical protein
MTTELDPVRVSYTHNVRQMRHSQKELEFEALHNPFLRFDVFANCLCI